MDVHVNNQTLIGADATMIHIFLPDDLIHETIGELPACDYVWVQTRFHSLSEPTPFVRMFSKKGRLCGRGGRTGIFTSVPVKYTEEMGQRILYNPFDVVVIKFPDANNGASIYIYYLLLFQGAKRAVAYEGIEQGEEETIQGISVSQNKEPDTHANLDKSVSTAPKGDLNDILQKITREIIGEQGHCSLGATLSPTSLSPAATLGLRLRAAVTTSTSEVRQSVRHHPALEEPSNIRGLDKRTHDVQKQALSSQSITPLHFSQLRLSMNAYQPGLAHVPHILTLHRLAIFAYGGLLSQRRLKLSEYLFPEQQQQAWNGIGSVLGVHAQEHQFLFHISDKIRTTFETALKNSKWLIGQEIPVTLPINYSRVYKDSNLLEEAFFTIQTRVSWESAWVKATLAGEPDSSPESSECTWIDSHPLYEAKPSIWGRIISTRTPNILGTSADLIHFASDGSYIHVAVSRKKTIVLILPGGFVIKGVLHLELAEELFVLARSHGHRRRIRNRETEAIS
ncbi:ORF22 [callitrichine gammaherpesvirus 3]|uniref:ORF22 n=1 Tax=callitrichine gammaherpesvirus 3 TaxID=106331 RepID=Q993I8_9GAMA|nr:ORF22 [callitrichine gammaherpesvirus 3]AAK38230.1 ORF22 [callitrichine gammaherpesvirus 3]